MEPEFEFRNSLSRNCILIGFSGTCSILSPLGSGSCLFQPCKPPGLDSFFFFLRFSSMCGCLFHSPLLGTCLATQACALSRNPNGNALVRRPVLSPLSHTSQGHMSTFLISFHTCLHTELVSCQMHPIVKDMPKFKGADAQEPQAGHKGRKGEEG